MRTQANKQDWCNEEITQVHPFDDSFIYRHFIEWLDDYSVDDEEWNLIYGRIYNLLYEEPTLVDNHSWSEMNRMALRQL